jgi:RNA polymerase sigma factor (sigma-70 family)
MSPSDETDIWRRAVAGDGAAFGTLFDTHHRRVFRHARRLTRDTHDAEDVMAAAFLELWRRRQKVRVVDGSVLPWLLVTTTHLALNQGRGLRRHRAFIDRLPRRQPSAEHVEPAYQGVDLDIDPELVAGIRRLRPLDQQLLALVALEDYRLAEAAEALGLTEHAARSRWQRIRRRLATHHTTTSSAVALEY